MVIIQAKPQRSLHQRNSELVPKCSGDSDADHRLLSLFAFPQHSAWSDARAGLWDWIHSFDTQKHLPKDTKTDMTSSFFFGKVGKLLFGVCVCFCVCICLWSLWRINPRFLSMSCLHDPMGCRSNAGILRLVGKVWIVSARKTSVRHIMLIKRVTHSKIHIIDTYSCCHIHGSDMFGLFRACLLLSCLPPL